jgi:hypothetical protein
MYLLRIPHAKDFPVCYNRRLFLNARMLHSPDKVGFEPRCVTCFEGLYRITFALVTEPDQK